MDDGWLRWTVEMNEIDHLAVQDSPEALTHSDDMGPPAKCARNATEGSSHWPGLNLGVGRGLWAQEHPHQDTDPGCSTRCHHFICQWLTVVLIGAYL